MRRAVLAAALAVASSLIAVGAFAGSAGATCAVGAQYDQYGNPCPAGSGGSQYVPPGSGGSQYGQYVPPGSGGSQYTPPGSGGSQYSQYGGGAPAVTPQASVTELRLQSQDLASGVDTVDDAQTLFGARAWRAEIQSSGSSTTIPDAEIAFNHVDPSWTFTPPLTAPVHAGPANVVPGSRLQALDLDFGQRQVNGVSIASGYDAWRTFDTTTIAPGGTRQTVTLHVVLRDATRYANGWTMLTVSPNWYGGSAGVATNDVTFGPLAGTGDYTSPSATILPDTVEWRIGNAQIGHEYTISVPIDVPNATGSSFPYKPMVMVHAGRDASLGMQTGASTQIADPELGGALGAWTYSAPVPVEWHASVGEIWQTNFEPIMPPGDAVASAVDWKTRMVRLPFANDSVDGSAVLLGSRRWEGSLNNWRPNTTVAGAEVSLGSAASSWSFDPPIALPLHAGPQSLGTFDRLQLATPEAGGVSMSTGYDLSRSFDTATIPGGGGRQTVTVSLTLRDPALQGGWAQIEVDAANWSGGSPATVDGANIGTSVVGAPSFAAAPFRTPSYVNWRIDNVQMNQTYTLTVPIDVANSGTTAFRYKPETRAWVGKDSFLPVVDGTDAQIADPELGGDWAFHTSSPVRFERSATTATQAVLEPIPAPSFTLALDRPEVTVHAGATFDEHVTVAPVNGFAGTVNFFTTSADGSYGPLGLPIWVIPWPAPVAVGPGPASWDIHSVVTTDVAPGDYTIYFSAWANGSPGQWLPVTVHVLPALTTRASVSLQRRRAVDVAGDSVAAGTALDGYRGWSGNLYNNGTDPISSAQVSIDGTDRVFSPDPGPFPRTSSQATVEPNSGLSLYELNGYPGSSREENVAVTPGVDVTRSTSVAQLPAAGGAETVTISVTPRDPSVTAGNLDVFVYGGQLQAEFSDATFPLLAGSELLFRQGVDPSTPTDGSNVAWSIGNPVLNRTYTLTFTATVPSAGGQSAFSYEPDVRVRTARYGGQDYLEGTSFSYADTQIGGAWTFSASDVVAWSFNTWDETELLLRSNVVATPFASAGDSRVTSIAASGDSLSATETAPGDLTWNPYILLRNPGFGTTLHAPQITADGTAAVTPPVAMPHTETGPDLSGAGPGFFDMTALAGDDAFSGSPGHSRAHLAAAAPGFDVVRSVSPAVSAAAGGTQTVTVSLTPRQDVRFAWIEIDAASVLPGATVDPTSVVSPPGDPDTYDVSFSPDNGSVTWTSFAPVVGETYTFAVQVSVPAHTGARLFKPLVHAGTENVSQIGDVTGTSATIDDALFGGTFTFSSTGVVDWRKVMLDTNDVRLAGQWEAAVAVDHFSVQPATASIGDGAPLKVTIRALDAANKVIPAYAGPISVDDTAHTLTLSSIAWAKGVATAFVTLHGPQTGDRIAVADAGASPAATGLSGPISVVGPVTRFTVVPASTSPAAGAPVLVTVRAHDGLNRIVQAYDGTTTRSYAEVGTATDPAGASGESCAKGVCTVTLVLPTIAKAAKIRVTDTSLGITSSSSGVNVLGPLDHFRVVVAPTSVPGDAMSQVTATIVAKDALDTTIPTFNGPIALADDLSGLVWNGLYSPWVNGVTTADVAFATLGIDRLSVQDASPPTPDFRAQGVSNAFAVFGGIVSFGVSVSPASVPLGGNVTVTAIARDSLGHTVVDYAGTPDVTDTGAGVVLDGAWTTTKGVLKASAHFTSTQKGARLTVTDNGLSAAPAGTSGAFNVTGPVTRLRVVVVPASVPVGGTIAVYAYAEDANGSTVVGFDGAGDAIAVSDADPSDPVISGGPLAWVNGVGKGTFQLDRPVKADKLTVTDTTAGLAGTSNAFNVTGPVVGLRVVVAPATVILGENQTLVATAVDALGSTVVGFDGAGHAIALTDSAAPAPPISIVTALAWLNGVGKAVLNIGAPVKADRLTVTDATAGVSGQSGAFTVVGPATRLKVSASPATITRPAQLGLTVTAQDDALNTVPSYAETLTYTDLTGTAAVAVESAWNKGVRTAKLTFAQARAADTVTVTGGGSSGTSNTFTVK
jgi:hypothetical protein